MHINMLWVIYSSYFASYYTIYNVALYSLYKMIWSSCLRVSESVQKDSFNSSKEYPLRSPLRIWIRARKYRPTQKFVSVIFKNYLISVVKHVHIYRSSAECKITPSFQAYRWTCHFEWWPGVGGGGLELSDFLRLSSCWRLERNNFHHACPMFTCSHSSLLAVIW
jgi:hypothetical protein